MQQEKILEKIESLRRDGGENNNAAVDLCLQDVVEAGWEHWLLWNSVDVAAVFQEIADHAVRDMVETVSSNQAGQALINEVLGEGDDGFDAVTESKKLAIASAKMFRVLCQYCSIHEILKVEYDWYIYSIRRRD